MYSYNNVILIQQCNTNLNHWQPHIAASANHPSPCYNTFTAAMYRLQQCTKCNYVALTFVKGILMASSWMVSYRLAFLLIIHPCNSIFIATMCPVQQCTKCNYVTLTFVMGILIATSWIVSSPLAFLSIIHLQLYAIRGSPFNSLWSGSSCRI